MNYNRFSRRNPAPWTRNYRRMKDETGQHGGGTPTPSGDNSGGNSGGNSGDSSGADNAGQGTDYSQFWRDPSSDDSNSAGSSGSASSGNQDGGSPNNQQQQQEQKPNPAGNLAQNIQSLDFGSEILTQSAIEKLGNGDASEFHANINKMGQQAVTSAIQLLVPILGQLRDQMREEFNSTVTSTNTNRDNESALLAAIPSAKDPKIKPIVDSIYRQALKIAKGDTDSAISMTKDMLKIQTQTLGEDLGIPPTSSGDNLGLPPGKKVDWLEELAGR